MRTHFSIPIVLSLVESLCWAGVPMAHDQTRTIELQLAKPSKESTELERLRQIAEATPTQSTEMAYLNAFPATFQRFKFTFYGESGVGELYDKHQDHLMLLEKLSKKYPAKVLSIWLSAATYGEWDADAIGILQHQLANYAAYNTKKFAEAILSKPLEQRLSIIKFLEDVENHSAYEEYKRTVENLKVLGLKELSKQFLRAKEEREKQQDH